MKLRFKKIKDNPVSLLRRVGYAFQRNEGEEMSFTRVLGRSGFPRFHIYALPDKADLVVSLHLDSKKETYGKATRHHGEYEDSVPVQEEAMRIWSLVKEYCDLN